MKVEVAPDMLRWACERAGYTDTALAGRFPKLGDWLSGSDRPTFKQLERFAKATHAPIGFLFLQAPPDETVPIPDLRTIGSARIERPTPDLLDTIYMCQQRQEWYREFAIAAGEPPLAFVGSARPTDDPVAAAALIRSALGLSTEEQRRASTWTDALRRLIDRADGLGVLVMLSGVVGSNNRRRLDPEEFRGFALADPVAPLVFVNGADTKAAQIFTLAHELAHLWLSESALSGIGIVVAGPVEGIEQWCNAVAAELLVPMEDFRGRLRPHEELRDALDRLAREFKVSTLVILRRLHDAGALSVDQLWREYQDEVASLGRMRRATGGDFYVTTAARVGKRFARAVVNATWEGRSSFTEACRLLGLKKMATFRELSISLGIGG